MSETRFCLECDRKTESGESYGKAYCRECGGFYEPELLAKRKEVIAEIRKWHDGEIEKFPPITVFEAIGFMLDELAEERAAHNAHVTELCELEKENRKLREDIERIIEILKNGQPAHWQIFKIRQLLEVPLE